MKSLRKIILLCLVYNVLCYGMTVFYDLIDEGLINLSRGMETLTFIFLFILVPLSVITAECLGFSRDFSRKERIVYTLVWAGISLVIMFTFGYAAANGHVIKQATGKMMNGVEYFLPGLLLCAAVPLLYVLLWLEQEIRTWWRNR